MERTLRAQGNLVQDYYKKFTPACRIGKEKYHHRNVKSNNDNGGGAMGGHRNKIMTRNIIAERQA